MALRNQSQHFTSSFAKQLLDVRCLKELMLHTETMTTAVKLLYHENLNVTIITCYTCYVEKFPNCLLQPRSPNEEN